MVYSRFWGSHVLTIGFKYAVQSFRTLWLLLRERPRVVFVMTPPVVACYPVWLYCLVTGSTMVIDAHTGAFTDPRWERLRFLHAFVSRRAATTLVTNDYLKSIVDAWGAEATIVRDVPLVFAEPEPFPLAQGDVMTFICTFTRDEPIEIMIEAARAVPEVQFYMTGNHARLDPALAARRPGNLTFTGFLPDANYVHLLRSSQAVICLTTADHTMQRGAYEAIYLERPVIVSDYEVLRGAFPRASVFVRNDVAALAAGIREMRAAAAAKAVEAKSLRQAKLDEWDRVVRRLRDGLDLDPAT
jgi:glycosyltransferase involved in cell wall biosynthesis